MQERCEREAKDVNVKSASLLAYNVDISAVRGKVASDEAVKRLGDELLAKITAWIAALPKRETK